MEKTAKDVWTASEPAAPASQLLTDWREAVGAEVGMGGSLEGATYISPFLRGLFGDFSGNLSCDPHDQTN